MTQAEVRRLLRWRKILIVAVTVAALAALGAAGGLRWFRHYRLQAAQYACDLAVKKAQDMLDQAWISRGELTEEEAEALVLESQIARETLCPSGGTYHLYADPDMDRHFFVVCGLHDSDGDRRVRANGLAALAQLEDRVSDDRWYGRDDPDTVEVALNGRSYTARRVAAPEDLSLGTGLTPGYSGVAVLYMLDEDGVCWLCWAEETVAYTYVR